MLLHRQSKGISQQAAILCHRHTAFCHKTVEAASVVKNSTLRVAMCAPSVAFKFIPLQYSRMHRKCEKRFMGGINVLGKMYGKL